MMINNVWPINYSAKNILYLILLFFGGLSSSFSQIRFQDDFESAYNPDPSNQVYNKWYKSGWNDGGYMATTDEISARHGTKSLKAVMVRNTDGLSRTETGVNLANSLGDYWYGFSIYIPDEIDFSKAVTDGSWYTVLAQWGVWLNNPGLPDFALRMDEQNFIITYEPSTGSPIVLIELPLIQGRWVDWVFHIDWTKENDGEFEVWQDEVHVFEKTAFQTTDGDGNDVKSKIGLYFAGWDERSSSLTSIYCYYDSYKIARGENELMNVAPWAVGSSENAPSGLFAESISYKQINLNWRDNSSNELGFKIERKTNGEFEQIAIVDSNVTFYSDTGLLASTIYTYRVVAFNSDSTIGISNEASEKSFTIGGVYQETDGIISIEAEHGELGSYWNIVEDPSAAGGKYLEVDPSFNNVSNEPECILPDCIVSYYFNVENTGNYRFWFRILSAGEDNDLFFWRLDDGHWINENNRNGNGVWYFTDIDEIDNLTQGNHIIEISYGENGTRLDKFVIQTDDKPALVGEGPLESNGSGMSPPLSPSNLVAHTISDKQIDLLWSDNSDNEEGFRIERKSGSSQFWAIAKVDSNITSYSDRFILNPSTVYTYRIRAYRSDLFSNYSNESKDTTFADPTSISEKSIPELPTKLSLEQNYPNPANPSTIITFTIPFDNSSVSNSGSQTSLQVFDMIGNKLATILDEYKSPGNYSVSFNPLSLNINLSSGIYFYRLNYGNQFITKKLIFLK